MSIPIVIMGDSGTGKSTSIRTFAKGEVMVLNVQGKLMPFFDPRPDMLNVPDKAREIVRGIKAEGAAS